MNLDFFKYWFGITFITGVVVFGASAFLLLLTWTPHELLRGTLLIGVLAIMSGLSAAVDYQRTH